MNSLIFATIIQFGLFSVCSAEKSSGRFWQVADLHWDQRYSTDGDPLQMCHSDETRSSSSSELHDKLGRYGIFGCDAPWNLVELSVKGMAAKEAEPDFIFWTGDNSPHTNDPKPDWSVIFTSLKTITSTIQQHLPNVTIFPVLGNHDVFPKDFYPSNSTSLYRRYLIEGGWDKLLTPATQETFVKCGYYSVEIESNLTVIVLNTNLYNPSNILTDHEDDPCGQLRWFEDQLQQASVEHYKVLISAHIPPGYFERWTVSPLFDSDKNDRYIQLIHDYGHLITGQVYGHTHTDSFRIFADNMTEAQSVAFMAPSVTPWLPVGGVNPGLRLYEYSSSGIEDYWQYYLNLSTSNENTDTPEWQLLYQATETYQITDLSGDNMLSVYKQLLTNRSVFDEYYMLNTVGYLFEECNAVCIRAHLCTIAQLRVEDMQRCLGGEHRLLRHDEQLSSRFTTISRQANFITTVSFDGGMLFGSIAVAVLIIAMIVSVIFIRCMVKQKRIQNYRQEDFMS